MPNHKNKKVRPGQRTAAVPKPPDDEPFQSIYSSDESSASSNDWEEGEYGYPTPGGGYVIQGWGYNKNALKKGQEAKQKKTKKPPPKPQDFSADSIKAKEMLLSERFGGSVSLSYIGDNKMFDPKEMKKSGKDYDQVMKEFVAENPKHSGKPAPTPPLLNFLELDSRLQKKICSKIPNFDSFEHMRQCSRVANEACEEVIKNSVSFKPIHQEKLEDVVEDFDNLDDMYYNTLPNNMGPIVFKHYELMRQDVVETVKKALARGPHIKLDIPSIVLDTYDIEELLPRLMSSHSSIRTLGLEASAISVDQFNQLCAQTNIHEAYLIHTENTPRSNYLTCPNISKLNKLRLRNYTQDMLSAMAPQPPRVITSINTCDLTTDGLLKFFEEYVQGKREITCIDIRYAVLTECDFEEMCRRLKALHSMTPHKKYRLSRDKKNYVMINITKEIVQNPDGPHRITRVNFRKISH